MNLYSPRAILLGTVSPIIAEGSEPIRAYVSRLRNGGGKVVLGDRRTMVPGDGVARGAGFDEFTQIHGGEPVKTSARFSMGRRGVGDRPSSLVRLSRARRHRCGSPPG